MTGIFKRIYSFNEYLSNIYFILVLLCHREYNSEQNRPKIPALSEANFLVGQDSQYTKQVKPIRG